MVAELDRDSPRYQNDQCNEAHLLYAKLKTFIARCGCRVRGSPLYENDERNEAHPQNANLKTFATRHGCRDGASPGAKLITTTRHIFCMQDSSPSELDMVADVEILPGTRMISAMKGILYMQN